MPGDLTDPSISIPSLTMTEGRLGLGGMCVAYTIRRGTSPKHPQEQACRNGVRNIYLTGYSGTARSVYRDLHIRISKPSKNLG